MDIDKAITGGVMGLVAVLMIVGVAQAMSPQPQYTCPICAAPFATYDELYQHFLESHPSEPIDIIWE